MIIINIKSTNHDFEKQNPITLLDKRGQYDLFKCSKCGLVGKARHLGGELSIDGRKSRIATNCPAAKRISKIRITQCHAVGRRFVNLTPGSIHEVVPTPDGKSDDRGVWVMGVGEPVKVLFDEFETIDE